MLKTGKLKISLLSASYRAGGAERVQVTLANEFAKMGHDVDFVSFEKDGELGKYLSRVVTNRCLGVSRIRQGLLPLVKYLHFEKPQIMIVSMEHVGIVSLIAKVVSRYQGKIFVRADYSRRYEKRGSTRVKALASDLLVRTLFSYADGILAVSSGIVRELEEDLGLTNCHLCPNPAFDEKLFEDSMQNVEHPFFDRNEPTIISVGRLHKKRGFEFLIRAFQLLRNKRAANLIILGEGSERNSLEKEIRRLGLESDVSLAGFVDQPMAYMRKADLYASAPESESFGLTIVEALAVGLPIVCNDNIGPRDILAGGKYGELVTNRDIQSFSEAIERCINGPRKSAEKLNARARKYTYRDIATNYLKIVNS